MAERLAASKVAAAEALSHYKAKRNFSITSEPAEGGEPATDALTFVVQKHWASRLHYDFRLELDGTMKSWAVPKGPSFDPHDKRMAVQVEDHPISYSSFEGTIPEKQYGAGKVIIWDKGTWAPLGDPHAGYRDGNLKFEIHGHKLHGRWVLVRMKGRGEKQVPWLLIKEKDDFVRPASEFSVVDEQPDSVKSLPMPVSTPTPTSTSTSTSTPSASGTPTPTSTPTSRAPKPVTPEGAALRQAAVAPVVLPETLAPQLATLVDGPPKDPSEWVYEIKFDGYRMLARIDGSDIRLITRNGNDWTDKLTPLARTLATLKLPTGWYDGEIVAINERGVPDFGQLQQSFDSARTADIVYYLFDAPFSGGRDLRNEPLEARRALLKQLLQAAPATRTVRFSEVFDAPPESIVASAYELGLEGVIAKRRDSVYASRRSADWIKLKCSHRQEFVIGGYTDPKGARNGIGSLLLGVYDASGALKYAGNVGTGFNEQSLADITTRLQAVASDCNPFDSKTGIVGRPHWVEPKLVAEVTFGEWTRDHRIRHSVFHGLRSDKPAREIVRETPGRAPPATRAAETPAKSQKAGNRAASSTEPQPLSSKLRITHGERVIDASSGITKIDLVRYYHLIGELMMAHLKGRPVSLVRAPEGVSGQLFFQKHADTEKLPGVRQLDPALYISHPAMLEIAASQGLLSAAQWNVIEIHTLNTSTRSFEHPDRMIFDLDPGDGVAWPQIQEAAEVVHLFLGQLGLPSYLKTSGGKGLHVVVPVRKVHDWDTVKGFSQAVVAHLSRTLPDRFVAKSGPKNRVGKIFIDYIRNGLGATTVCAWSARARPGMGISVPVRWDELPRLTGGDQWTIRSAHDRLDEGNSPWDGYAKAAKSLNAAIKTLGWKPETVESG